MNKLIEDVAQEMMDAIGAVYVDLDGVDRRHYECMAKAAVEFVLEQAAKCVKRQPSPSSDWIAEKVRALNGGTP